MQILLPYLKHNGNEQQHNKYHGKQYLREALAKTTPLNPPIVNINTKPNANNIEGVNCNRSSVTCS